MNLTGWLLAELDETVARWHAQVIDLVPAASRGVAVPGGNSIRWSTYHVARHADLALAVAGRPERPSGDLLASFPAAARAGGGGLQEPQQPWVIDLDQVAVDAYAAAVFAEVRSYLESADPASFDRPADPASALLAAGVGVGEFGWLHRMWNAPLGFLVRWPLTGHITNHVGEMIGVRGQLGFSPFR